MALKKRVTGSVSLIDSESGALGREEKVLSQGPALENVALMRAQRGSLGTLDMCARAWHVCMRQGHMYSLVGTWRMREIRFHRNLGCP